MVDGKKNFTSKPIQDGTKTPQNNQGTVPSPEGGSTDGKGNESRVNDTDSKSEGE